MAKRSLEESYRQLITTRRPSVGAQILRASLLPPSWILSRWMGLRNWAYDKQFFDIHQCPIPVISIGNLSLGGTGKTPVTQALAQRLSQTRKVAILSRGYRSPAEKSTAPQILSLGEGPILPASDTGDEAYLLASQLPESIVIVGRDRVASAHLAIELGAGVILLDDGMQHRRLGRDLDIVVVDANDPLGAGYCFPRGLLREPPKALQRASLLILTHCEACQKNAVTEALKPFTKAPAIATQFHSVGCRDTEGELIEDLTGTKLGIFSGVAQPERVRRSVGDLGAIIVGQEILGDHRSITPAQLLTLSKEFKKRGAKYLVCTEKDFVKLSPAHHKASSLPILWIQRDLSIDPADLDLLDQLIGSLV